MNVLDKNRCLVSKFASSKAHRKYEKFVCKSQLAYLPPPTAAHTALTHPSHTLIKLTYINISSALPKIVTKCLHKYIHIYLYVGRHVASFSHLFFFFIICSLSPSVCQNHQRHIHALPVHRLDRAVLPRVGQLVAQPIQTFVESCALCCARCLHVPFSP